MFGTVDLEDFTLGATVVSGDDLHKITSMDMVQKIRREIQFLRVLRHPHIIRLCVSRVLCRGATWGSGMHADVLPPATAGHILPHTVRCGVEPRAC